MAKGKKCTGSDGEGTSPKTALVHVTQPFLSIFPQNSSPEILRVFSLRHNEGACDKMLASCQQSAADMWQTIMLFNLFYMISWQPMLWEPPFRIFREKKFRPPPFHKQPRQDMSQTIMFINLFKLISGQTISTPKPKNIRTTSRGTICKIFRKCQSDVSTLTYHFRKLLWLCNCFYTLFYF